MTFTRRQLLEHVLAGMGVGAAMLLNGCKALQPKTDFSSDVYRQTKQDNASPAEAPGHRQPLVVSSDEASIAGIVDQPVQPVAHLVREGTLRDLDPTRNIMYLALDIERLFGIDVPDETYTILDRIREAASSSILPDQQPESKLRAVDKILYDTFNYKATGKIDLLTGKIQDQVTTLSEGLDAQRKQLDCDTSSILFIGIGEDLGWPVQGVRVPYHFFVRWALPDQRFHPYINWDPINRDRFMDLSFWVNYNVDKPARDSGIYMKSLSRDQTISTIFEQVGRALRKKGRYENAVEAYARAIELDDMNVFAWNNQGDALIQLKLYEAALGSLSSSVKRDPTFIDSYKGLAFAHRQLGHEKEAKEAEVTAEHIWKERHHRD